MPRAHLSLARLRELIRYDAESEWLIWLPRPELPAIWNAHFAGKRAGTLDSRGRRFVRIEGHQHNERRLIFALLNGRWPGPRHPRSHNRARLRGVYFEPRRQRWRAEIMIAGRRIKLGRFVTPEAAALAYREFVQAA
jgi:hypothetical protein